MPGRQKSAGCQTWRVQTEGRKASLETRKHAQAKQTQLNTNTNSSLCGRRPTPPVVWRAQMGMVGRWVLAYAPPAPGGAPPAVIPGNGMGMGAPGW